MYKASLSQNKIWLILEYILIIFPIAALLYLYTYNAPIVIYVDTKNYLYLCELIAEKRYFEPMSPSLNTIYAPLYPIFLYILKMVFGDPVLGFKIVAPFIMLVSFMMVWRAVSDMQHGALRFSIMLLGVLYVEICGFYVFMLAESILLPFLIYYIFSINEPERLDSNGRKIFLKKNLLIIILFFLKYNVLILILGVILMEFFKYRSLKVLVSKYWLSGLSVLSWFVFCFSRSGSFTGDPLVYQGLLKQHLSNLGYHLAHIFTLIPCISLLIFKKKDHFDLKNMILLLVFYTSILFVFYIFGRVVLDERILLPVSILSWCICLKVIKDNEYLKLRSREVAVVYVISALQFLRFVKNYLFWVRDY